MSVVDQPASLDDDDDDDQATAALVASVARLTGARCADCARGLCGHQALLSVVLGFRDAPRCDQCLAERLEADRSGLLTRAYEHISRRACFARALAFASQAEGLGGGAACIFAAAAARPEPPAGRPPAGDGAVAFDEAWDAGEMSCGELVLALRARLAAMAPGAILALRATDLAAPLDIPAWCGLTGHRLVASSPPRYYVRRKDH